MNNDLLVKIFFIWIVKSVIPGPIIKQKIIDKHLSIDEST